ncbi:MAG TPA: phosphate ABC transporter permease subunit PstC [Steroidobacteraceae bacterium]|nr:phosphate ABC transporter permease subunit PstC [Steroidobacteraceae bacterium]
MDSSEAAVESKLPPAIEEPAAAGRGLSLPADFLFHKLAVFMAAVVGATLVAAVAAIGYDSLPAIKVFGVLGFLESRRWDPVSQQFGAYPFIVGTLVSSAIAMLLAVPVSFGVAVFISELAPGWIKQPISAAIEMLAAVPSIVYGLWGLLVFAPAFANLEPWINDHLGAIWGVGALFRGPPMGIGMLAAGIVLAIMILPYIASIMRDVFVATPARLKESAYAMGATTWEVARRILLPYTRTAVTGGIFLGLGRALGETMAVTFVIGNSNNLSRSLLMPGASIPSVIANEFTEATSKLYVSSLIYLGLVLIAITLVVQILAVFLLGSLRRAPGGTR